MGNHFRFQGEVRHALLEQHHEVRARIATAEALSQQLQTGEQSADALTDAVTALVSALVRHNASEEAALEPLLLLSDAFGPVRLDRLVEHHRAEHRMLERALHETTDSGHAPEAMAALVQAALAAILAHMDAEELESLSPGVLRAASADIAAR